MGEEKGSVPHGGHATQAAAEAFGAEPVAADAIAMAPDARRRLQVRLARAWRPDPGRATPTRVARAVGFASAAILWLNPRSTLGLHSSVEGRVIASAIAGFVILVPGWAVERWYRVRRRRQQEQLLPPAS